MAEAEEHLLYSGGGETVPCRMERRQKTGWAVQGGVLIFFLDEYYLNPTLYNLAKKRG